ncbi:hypothetical protein [Streptomyces cavernae]|uniref:hypothetical protein n=1 Tax=Streptomyces cavernae TaxID=2259034 RepID=UPI000FEB809F|nr:hypothetical protein [Streptomyces cavernae]
MDEPNVLGDWQECEGHAGLRVRVHGLERAEPPRGRDEAAAGLTYFRFRVTVENRSTRRCGVHLEDGQIEVRLGTDGEAAFLDWRNSQFVEGFDVYPLRRVTAVLYAAGPEAALNRLDVQVQPKIDDDWDERYLWAGGIGLHEGPIDTEARPSAAGDSLASQVIRFLEREAGPGPGAG